jgi:endoglucanase
MEEQISCDNRVAVNQLGYRRGDHKTVVLQGAGGGFRLVDDEDGNTVWSGTSGPVIRDAASGAALYRGEFSVWSKPGRYRIMTDDGRSTEPFHIANEVYSGVHRALLKAFYYFRCGMELEERFAGPWTHKSCHLDSARVYGEEGRPCLDVSGGWHDAGDYGKYAGPGAKAAADLMLAYQHYPGAFAVPLPLPETNGIMPDVLHECRYELDWLLKMQDTTTGGVFHKVTTRQFPGYDVMPEDDRADLYLLPVSATATGCFAGVMAMAARVYASFDKAFASACLEAAEKAWDWLVHNQDAAGFRNPPGVATGEYGDINDTDERYWAAAELYRTTGEAGYHQAFQELALLDSFDKYELGWAQMGGYGTLAYLLADREKAPWLAAALQQGLVERADAFVRIAHGEGYRISLRPDQYKWGSNMLVMNHAMLLLMAWRLTGTPVYESCALDHIHYIFGLNALGISYVTGFGAKRIMHPHHRPSEGDGVEEPVPGLVAGGPNGGLHDEYARTNLQGLPPMKCYADHMESYSTNEVAVYWNSPALYAVSHFAAPKSRDRL